MSRASEVVVLKALLGLREMPIFLVEKNRKMAIVVVSRLNTLRIGAQTLRPNAPKLTHRSLGVTRQSTGN